MDEQTSVAASSHTTRNIIIGAVALLVLIGIGLTLAGGFGSRARVAPGTDMDRNLDGSTTYSTDEGSVTVGGNTMPSNWPSDVPEAYSGATIAYSGSTNPTTGAAGAAVVYTVKNSVASVVEYYESGLKRAGWTITATADAGGMRVITATKDTRTFGAYIGDDGQGNTSVTVGIEL